MTTVIKDLPLNEEMDHNAMADVRGGYFAMALGLAYGLKNMSESEPSAPCAGGPLNEVGT